MARQIIVEFIGNDRSLSRAVKSAESSTGRLSRSLKNVGRVAGVALAGGAIIAGKAMFDMTKAAAEDEVSQARLAKTLKNTAGATKDNIAGVELWIDSTARATGVADDQLRPAMEKLLAATGSMGDSMNLTTLAMDAAAGSGKSVETVAAAMAKAHNGNTGALSKLNIATKDASGKSLTFHEITKKMADTFGGQAAKKAETFQGKMDRLKVILSETGEDIGAKLLPKLTVMADWFLNKGLPALENFGGWIKDNLGPIFDRIGDVVSKVMGTMRTDVDGNLTVIKGIIKDFVTIARALWDRFGGTILTIVKRAFAAIQKIVSGALLVIRGIIRVVAGVLTGDWSKAWSGIKDIVRGAARVVVTIVKTLFSNAKDLVKVGATVIVDIFKGMKGRIGAAASGMFDGLKNAFRSAINYIIDGWNNLSFGLPAFDPPGPGKFPAVSINTPNIPRMAKGGIVTSPTLALIGEAGPEAVVPLSRGGGFGGGKQVIQLVVDSKVLAQVLVDHKRGLGRNLGLA